MAIVGQTKLLLEKKFKQFEGLIERCETQKSDSLKVTLDDLQGFWEMMYQQVDLCILYLCIIDEITMLCTSTSKVYEEHSIDFFMSSIPQQNVA